MISDAIANNEVVVFLGAGASFPYGKKLMGDFVQHFKEEVDRSPQWNPLLDAILLKKADLEFLIEELQDLEAKQYLSEHRISSAEPVAGPGSSVVTYPQFADIGIHARNLLVRVKRAVYLHYRNIEDSARTADLLKAIEALRNPGMTTVVFTTNYDPAVEILCELNNIELTDGFHHDSRKRQYIWSRRVFDEFVEPKNKTIVLFKLHGSADWFQHDGSIIKALPMIGDPDPDYQNLMIYPATRKVAIEDPHFTAYDYLEKSLTRAKRCLVIGYSFRDYDTLMRFKAAAIANPDLRVAVLDPVAESIKEQLSRHGIPVTAIPYIFGSAQEEKYLQAISILKARGDLVKKARANRSI